MRILTLALLLSSPVALAGNELPLDPEKMMEECPSECIATDAKGALLCIEGTESLSAWDCYAQWLEPGQPAGAADWKRLVDDNGREASVFDKSSAAAFSRRKSTPVSALFATEPFTTLTAPQTLSAQGATLVVDAKTLTLERGDFKATFAWPERVQLEGAEEVRAAIYPLGKAYLAMLVIKDPGLVVQRTIWVTLEADGAPEPPTGCPPEAKCPADYGRTKAYFDAFCDYRISGIGRAIGSGPEDDLVAAVRAKKVSAESLVALFNLHGASYGYTFKQEKWLNDFYYNDPKWLPLSCQKLIRMYATAADVRELLTMQRDSVKKLWQSVK